MTRWLPVLALLASPFCSPIRAQPTPPRGSTTSQPRPFLEAWKDWPPEVFSHE